MKDQLLHKIALLKKDQLIALWELSTHHKDNFQTEINLQVQEKVALHKKGTLHWGNIPTEIGFQV